MANTVQGFWKGLCREIGLILMLLWVLLLIIGTIAEIFKIERILDWPIWEPPGKYSRSP